MLVSSVSWLEVLATPRYLVHLNLFGVTSLGMVITVLHFINIARLRKQVLLSNIIRMANDGTGAEIKFVIIMA